ncbi:class I SAM-dependent methyltransferase [Alteribacillus sp. HJP-4]|uniref:class I SAM-dependent methyltransferase n=1 Tax=Alteribacillus sp. HJP-4 TaxID=2775394 RepID=UPI0035CD12FE
MKDRWNAELYDRKHSFVSNYGDSLIDILAPAPGEKILDLGCGTGDLTRKIADFSCDVLGIDNSPTMIAQAKRKYPALTFDVRDAIDFEYHREFDAVFSNAALHWVKPPEKALQCIFASLKESGRFVAELGGKGNVQTITDEITKQCNNLSINEHMDRFPWYYPSIGEYSSLMEQTGFRVTFAEHFDRPTPLEGENGLRNWINMFAGSMLEGVNDSKKDTLISRVEHNLKAELYQKGSWTADYKRIRVIGIKE